MNIKTYDVNAKSRVTDLEATYAPLKHEIRLHIRLYQRLVHIIGSRNGESHGPVASMQLVTHADDNTNKTVLLEPVLKMSVCTYKGLALVTA
jgi:hypothetical protein